MNFNNNNNKKMNDEVELNDNKGDLKMNKKELKKINKKETCGTFTVNREFGKEFKKITGECATLTKVEKIRNIISAEIDNEAITTEKELLQRRFELIHELYILEEEVQPREKELKIQDKKTQTPMNKIKNVRFNMNNKKNNNKENCNPFVVLKEYKEKNKRLKEAIQQVKEDNQKINKYTELILAGELTDEEIEQIREEIFPNMKTN